MARIKGDANDNEGPGKQSQCKEVQPSPALQKYSDTQAIPQVTEKEKQRQNYEGKFLCKTAHPALTEF